MPSYVSSKGESDFTPIAAGTYVGRCYIVCNLGVQAAGPWEPKNRHYIGFEIPTERVTWTDKEGKDSEGPAIIGGRYTSSLSPKAILRQQLETWRGALFTDEQLAKFDLFNLIGVPAMISVVHSEDRKYANISGLMRLPQGIVCGPAEIPTIAYDPADPQADEVFQKLTNRMQETVKKGQLDPASRSPGDNGSGVYVPAANTENPAPTGHQEPSPPGHQSRSEFLQQGEQVPPQDTDPDDDIPF